MLVLGCDTIVAMTGWGIGPAVSGSTTHSDCVDVGAGLCLCVPMAAQFQRVTTCQACGCGKNDRALHMLTR